MAEKNNIRSFRYSDEIAVILKSQPGDSLNTKFENLVRACYCDIESRKQELERINAKIEERRQTLRNLEKATAELDMLEKDIKSARFSFGIVESRAAEIAEKTKNL